MFYTNLAELIYFLSCLHIILHGYLIVVILIKILSLNGVLFHRVNEIFERIISDTQ